MKLGSKDKASKLSSFYSRLKQNPIEALDSLELKGHGYCFNTSRIEIGLRKSFFHINHYKFRGKSFSVPSGLIVFALIAWVVCGWDSSPHQITNFTNGIPDYLMGKISWDTLVGYYYAAYGRFEHYSAFVIYATYYYFISKYLNEKLNITKLKNVLITTGLVAIPIGAFEIFWMVSYYFLQNQPWILALQMPQLRIILQNAFAFPIIGAIVLIPFVDWKQFKLNLGPKTWMYLVATFGLILVWYFYGYLFLVQRISVPVEGYGTWVSSLYFPQTYYVVDTNVLDNIAVGDQFWIQNDLLHLVNILAKVFTTLTFYELFKLKAKN